MEKKIDLYLSFAFSSVKNRGGRGGAPVIDRSWESLIPRLADQEHAEELHSGHGRGGDISQSGRRKNPAGSIELLASEIAPFPEQGHRPLGGIELHRKRENAEENGPGEQENADVHQDARSLLAHEEADEEEGEGQSRAQVGDWIDAVAEVEGGISRVVLQGVSGLMSGDAEGGDGLALIDAGL